MPLKRSQLLALLILVTLLAAYAIIKTLLG
jgi:hypothetical protein